MFQILIPSIFDNKSELQKFVKFVLLKWFKTVGSLLNLEKNILQQAHQDQYETNDPNAETESQSKYLNCRLVLMFLLFFATLPLFGLCFFTIPLIFGHEILLFVEHNRVNIFNIGTFGVYSLFLLNRIFRFIWMRFVLDFSQVRNKMKIFFLIVGKATIFSLITLLIIPISIGILFDVVILMPIRVPLNQTPIILLWQDYLFGILLTHLISLLIIITNESFRHSVEHVSIYISLHLVQLY